MKWLARLPIVRHVAVLALVVYLLASGKLAALDYKELQGLVERWRGR